MNSHIVKTSKLQQQLVSACGLLTFSHSSPFSVVFGSWWSGARNSCSALYPHVLHMCGSKNRSDMIKKHLQAVPGTDFKSGQKPGCVSGIMETCDWTQSCGTGNIPQQLWDLKESVRASYSCDCYFYQHQNWLYRLFWPLKDKCSGTKKTLMMKDERFEYEHFLSEAQCLPITGVFCCSHLRKFCVLSVDKAGVHVHWMSPVLKQSCNKHNSLFKSLPTCCAATLISVALQRLFEQFYYFNILLSYLLSQTNVYLSTWMVLQNQCCFIMFVH